MFFLGIKYSKLELLLEVRRPPRGRQACWSCVTLIRVCGCVSELTVELDLALHLTQRVLGGTLVAGEVVWLEVPDGEVHLEGVLVHYHFLVHILAAVYYLGTCGRSQGGF